MLLSSCADTERYIADEEPEEPVQIPYETAWLQWDAALPFASFTDASETVPTDTLAADYDDYLENQDFKANRVVTLTWSGETVAVDNPQEKKGVTVTVNGGRVVVTNLESTEDADDARGKVTYRLQGTSDNGQLKVYSAKKFQLVLAGIELTCPDGPAISIQTKKRCFVTLDEGTANVLCDSATYASDAVAEPEEDEKGCLFSEGQLIFSGKGALTVTGHHQHGIASDEYIRVHSGCHIDVKDSPKDGIHSKQQYQQTGGLVRSYSTKDALQADSLGISVTGGSLYLCGERAYTAGGGGEASVNDPGQWVPLSWGVTR